MASFTTSPTFGTTTSDLWVDNPNNSIGETFAGPTGSQGSILSGSLRLTFSSYTFEDQGRIYTYTGSFEVTIVSGLLMGTVTASGYYDRVSVEEGGIVEYSGVAIPVDFGTAQSGLLGTINNLTNPLGTINSLLFGGANPAPIANLHLDATPQLPAIAFAGADTIVGNIEDDVLSGYAGNDVIVGGGGADTLDGGTGDDIVDYTGSLAAVRVDLTSGVGVGGAAQGDTLVNFENIRGSQFGDRLTGDSGANVFQAGAGADTLFGMDGADKLNGGLGADVMTGGLGDDLYYVDDAGDRVIETSDQGDDAVQSTIDYTLTANVETLRLTGTAAIDGTGNGAANVIFGNDAANVIDGAGGADSMSGRLGNDRYIVDNVLDRVLERENEGIDTVETSVSYKLGANVENATLTGAGVLTVIGNELDNTIVGNDSANRLYGGLGADTLTGGLGADLFLFDTALGNGNIDAITDFDAAADTIRLFSDVFGGLPTGYIARDALAAGSEAADASDRIIYDRGNGALFFDRDGSGTQYGAVQFATLDSGLDLTFKDFVVV